MKTACLFIFLLFCSLHGTVTLVSQDFASTSFPPAGWSMEGPSTAVWSRSATNYSGGTEGELMLYYQPSAYGTYKFISPSFDTRKVHDMTLNFRHCLSDYGTIVTYTIGVMFYSGATGWSTVWSDVSSTNIPATPVSFTIPYSLGRSADTKIAFFFEGYNYDINRWTVDDISLTYNDTLGEGIWTAGFHYPAGNLIIPDGCTLTLEAGATVYFEGSARLNVEGRLLANGIPSARVNFYALTSTYWGGIRIYNVDTANDSTIINFANINNCYEHALHVISTHKVRISNTSISQCSGSTGVGLYCQASNLKMDHCSIYNNGATVNGAALYVSGGSPRIQYNYIFHNTLAGSGNGIVFLNGCSADNISYNIIANNGYNAGSRTVVLACAGTFHHNLIANNGNYGIGVEYPPWVPVIRNCDIVNNAEGGIYTSAALTINSSVIWGNAGWQMFNAGVSTDPTVSYCCVQNGLGGINNLSASKFLNCISSDPLFVDPTAGNGTGYEGYTADWSLQDFSPCIDTGDPAYAHNADNSIEDIGAYPRKLKPLITAAADFSPDQGHQLDLQWNRNDKDYSYDPGAEYLVFREGASRDGNAVMVINPMQITPGLVSENREIAWRDGERTWYLIGSYPALNQETYGLIVPTARDSSSTGTHAANYRVTYRDNVYFWPSVSASGYSVDNIPPYAPSRVDITRSAGNLVNLSWDEVTEGGWEGNSYPEVNGITYKVYASDTPIFEVSPATYLLSTPDLSTVLNNQTDARRFYKIAATDSE